MDQLISLMVGLFLLPRQISKGADDFLNHNPSSGLIPGHKCAAMFVFSAFLHSFQSAVIPDDCFLVSVFDFLFDIAAVFLGSVYAMKRRNDCCISMFFCPLPRALLSCYESQSFC